MTAGSEDGRRVVLVANPAKVDDLDALRKSVAERARSAGWAEPVVLETTEEDPGRGMARQALQDGAALVLVAGGDGTVMAVVDGLAGSGVPLGVLPQGTGNLLARNLGLPLDPETALDVAFSGVDRRLDVGRTADRRFAVMAGIGFDADMMADAPESLKARVGWPAYAVSAAKHLRRQGFEVAVRVDGGPEVRTRARTVVVGNVGELQGGVCLMPDAEPDDGRLDVAVVAPRSMLEWVGVVARVVRRRTGGGDRRLKQLSGARIEIRTRHPQRRQLDGDGIDDGSRLDVEVEPGALVVRVPPAEESAS